MMLTTLSLFAGIGGLDLGIERAGLGITKYYSEVDPYACKVMAKHWPDAQNLGDITQINWDQIPEPIDCIIGGFPCQDISLAGKGAGIAEGTRSGLWSYYVNAIRSLRPRIVIVENVAALTNRGLDRVLGDLAACGYDAEWDCVSAQSVGAPHIRQRLFIVAYPYSAPGEGDWGTVRSWPEPTVDQEHGWWAVEPSVGRVADGIPHRAHRLRCLGNAVVPQVAEHVARIALERIELINKGVEA